MGGLRDSIATVRNNGTQGEDVVSSKQSGEGGLVDREDIQSSVQVQVEGSKKKRWREELVARLRQPK